MIFQIQVWNFHGFGVFRSKEWFYKTRTYGNFQPDVVRINTWSVHSIGKKVMRLVDFNGDMRKVAVYSQWFNENFYHASLETAISEAKRMHAEDTEPTKQKLEIQITEK